MNILKYVLLATSITLVGCATMRVDPGGHHGWYKTQISRTQRTGEKVIIDYECDSACLILLSSGTGLRVSKTAIFGVHETRFMLPGTDYLDSTSRRCESCTEELKTLIPKCAVKLFESKHAFDHPNLTYFRGEEVLRSCPEIKEYAAA